MAKKINGRKWRQYRQVDQPFVSALGMAESKKSEAIANAIRKRKGLTHHPMRGRFCSCGPDCGAYYIDDKTVDMREITLFKRKPNGQITRLEATKSNDSCCEFL